MSIACYTSVTDYRESKYQKYQKYQNIKNFKNIKTRSIRDSCQTSKPNDHRENVWEAVSYKEDYAVSGRKRSQRSIFENQL